MNKLVLRSALLTMTVLGSGALLAPAPAMAQVGQASLRGTITAPADNPVTEVTAIEVSTGIRRSATVGADGTYNFASLRPGTYRLEIKLQNGVRNSDAFTLRVGQNAGLDLDLSTTAAAPAADAGAAPAGDDTAAAATGDEIVVTGNRIRSLDGGQIGINITQRLIEQLPQNNRNFLAFADLAPGVRFIEGANGTSSIKGGAQDSRTVNVFIDGVSQKDYVLKNGITGQDSSAGNPFPQLAIGEYQVLSSNYKAEFDQVSSVAITAATKSGTNEFHGEGFIDYTNQDLRARRPTELFPSLRDKVNSNNKQFGVALGGPIIQDRAHFFVTYEGKRIDSPYDVRPENGFPVGSIPSQYQQYFGSFSQRFNEDLYFGKIDIEPTDKDLIELTGKYRKESGSQIATGVNAANTATLNKVDEKRFMLRWQRSEDNWINDARVSYQDTKWAPTPETNGNTTFFQASTVNNGNFTRTDLLRFGGGGSQQDKGQKGWTLQDDFTWTGFNGHTIKIGTKASFIRLRSIEQNRANPQYTYDINAFSPTGFNDQVPYLLEFGVPTGNGPIDVRSSNFQFGVYAQDDWDVTSHLTLNLGLRWDYERTPAFVNYVTSQENLTAVSPANYPNLVNADYNINDYISNGRNRKTFTGAFQPRLGFTYRIDEAGRFAVFGGYGRSYDRNQFDFLQQEVNQGAYAVRRFNFIGADSNPGNACNAADASTCLTWNPVYLTPEGRQQLLAGATGGGREFRFLKNDLKVPYSDQFSLGIRGRFQQIGLELGYSHVASKNGFVFLLGNRRPDGSFFFNDPANPTDTPSAPFGFSPPGYNSIILGTNGLKTNADSVYFKVTKSYTQASPWSLDATYTYTEATENQLGETYLLDFPSVSDYPMLRSAGVPRHRLVMAGSVDLPLGFALSSKFQIESSAYQKAILNQSNPFQRVVVGREVDGSGGGWGRRQLDMALTKYVPIHFISDQTRLRFRVDVLNVFNDYNYITFNNDPASQDWGARSSYDVGGNPPRTVKLSVGYSF